MKMKTSKRFKISFTIIMFLMAGFFVSCQQGDNINEKVQNEVESLRDDLNDLKEDDSNFANNLHDELEDFEESMNDLKEDMNESGKQVTMEARQAINDLQAEARTLRMKIERRTQAGDNNSGIVGNRMDRDNGLERDNDLLGRDNDNGIRDAVSGDRTAQAQRDTSIRDNVGTRSYSDNNQLIDQELRADFQSFRQNVNQWVDRLSAGTDGRQNYD